MHACMYMDALFLLKKNCGLTYFRLQISSSMHDGGLRSGQVGEGNNHTCAMNI